MEKLLSNFEEKESYVEKLKKSKNEFLKIISNKEKFIEIKEEYN